MSDTPITAISLPYHANRREYIQIYVFCKNCRSYHYQYFKKGYSVTVCPCGKCHTDNIVPSGLTCDEVQKEQKEREKKSRGW